jgi:hypothetical protein
MSSNYMCDKWNCEDCELCQLPFRIVCDVHSTDEKYDEEYVSTLSATYRNYKIWDLAWGAQYEESDSISENKSNREAQKILKDWFNKSVYIMQNNLLDGINDIILTSTKEKVTPSHYVTLKLRIIPVKD